MFIDTVSNVVHKTGDSCIDQLFCAVDTREMGDVTGAVFDGYPMEGCLDNGVGFCMDGADAVTVYK